MKYHIGCSGYYYPAWKNKFYPAGLAPAKWLSYYSSVFDTVELNGTFYRLPQLANLRKYASVTPGSFVFSVKMSRYITHIQRLKAQLEIHKFQDLVLEGLGEKLLHFLFQMPPSFHYSEENLARVVENVPPRPQNVIEFRHASWWEEPVLKALKKTGFTFCNVDYPGLTSHIVYTPPSFYLRLHGNPILFTSSYEKKKLESFASQFPDDGKTCTIYFNNTSQEAGYTNAQELLKIVGKNNHAYA